MIQSDKNIALSKDNIQVQSDQVLKNFDDSQTQDKFMKKVTILIYTTLFLMGVGTGYLLSNNGSLRSNTASSSDIINTDKVVGSTDTKTFKDSAAGIMKKGGIDGEGSHFLEREGGTSQNVYLISSVVDLDQFIGKKVTVWGQTMAAQKAGWLMDVGKVELE